MKTEVKLSKILYNIEDRVYFSHFIALKDKDIKNIKMTYEPFGIKFDEKIFDSLIRNQKIKIDNNSNLIEIKLNNHDSIFGEHLESTLNLGYFLKNNEAILKEFCVNYAYNLIAQSVHDNYYDRKYHLENQHEIIKSFKEIKLPDFFKEDWKKEVDFESAQKGKFKPLIKNSKSKKLNNFIIKWIKVNGISSEVPHYVENSSIITVEHIIDIFKYCLVMYSEYEKFSENRLKNITIDMTFNITFGKEENSIEQSCENLIDKFYFEMLTEKLQKGKVLKFCDNCKKFYFGNPRQTACSSRCRDILSGKYVKRKGK